MDDAITADQYEQIINKLDSIIRESNPEIAPRLLPLDPKSILHPRPTKPGSTDDSSAAHSLPSKTTSENRRCCVSNQKIPKPPQQLVACLHPPPFPDPIAYPTCSNAQYLCLYLRTGLPQMQNAREFENSRALWLFESRLGKPGYATRLRRCRGPSGCSGRSNQPQRR